MSRFPRRLVDELDEGHARRLLERGRTDAPPARLVSDAIQAASRGTRMPASSDPPRRLTRSRIAIVAGTLVTGGLLAWFGTRELSMSPPSSASSVITSPQAPQAPQASADDEAKPEENVPQRAPATSVADLPDAPAPAVAMTAGTARRPIDPPRAAAANTPLPETTTDPADLLREANRLRAQGRWSEASSTYQRVIDLGPGSAEAYPADVALGNLDLQQSRAADALARYEHALTSHPTGALSEEARWGKARALRVLGRATEERAALEEFRAKHPDSALFPAAAQRLSEIGR